MRLSSGQKDKCREEDIREFIFILATNHMEWNYKSYKYLITANHGSHWMCLIRGEKKGSERNITLTFLLSCLVQIPSSNPATLGQDKIGVSF